jgi:hypothetical protein
MYKKSLWRSQQDSDLQPNPLLKPEHGRSQEQALLGQGGEPYFCCQRRSLRSTNISNVDQSEQARLVEWCPADPCELQHRALDFAFRSSGSTTNIPRTHSTDFPPVEVPSFGSVLPMTASRTSPRRWRKPNKTTGFCGGRTRDRTLDLCRVKRAPDARRLFVAV